jgi:hypothetical protein
LAAAKGERINETIKLFVAVIASFVVAAPIVVWTAERIGGST